MKLHHTLACVIAIGCAQSRIIDDVDTGIPDGSAGLDVKNDTNTLDTGTKMDGGVDSGPGGPDCHPDAGWNPPSPPACPTPRNLNGWLPGTLTAPVGKHTAACQQSQLDLYHQCTVQSNMTACMQVQQQAMTTFKTCLACLETTAVDPKWGPLVCIDSQTCYLNVEGCMNLALNTSGCTSCGQYLFESYACQRVACEQQCSGNAQGFSQCVQVALNGACKTYGDTFTNNCGTKSAQTDPELDNCFRRMAEVDSKALRVRMDTYMCGN